MNADDDEGIVEDAGPFSEAPTFEDLMIGRPIVRAPVSVGKRQRKWGREVAESGRACPVPGGNI